MAGATGTKELERGGDREDPPTALLIPLPGGRRIEAAIVTAGGGKGGAADESNGARVFATPLRRRVALFLLIEGISAARAEAFHDVVRQALEEDSGTPGSTLVRAVRAGCLMLAERVLQPHELTAFGMSALLVEVGQMATGYLAQLPPCQAYVYDGPEGAALRSLPQEQMEGAGRIPAAGGRRLDVELEVFRIALRPGAAALLCSAGLAGGLSIRQLGYLLRRPLVDAARELAQTGRPRRDAPSDAILIGFQESPARQRARLLSVADIAARNARLRADGRLATTAAAWPHLPSRQERERAGGGLLRGPRLEAWGLARRRRDRLSWLGVLGWPLQWVPLGRGRRRGAGRWIWPLAAVLIAGGYAAARPWPSCAPSVGSTVTQSVPAVLPAAAPLAGRPVATAEPPARFRSLAVTEARPGRPARAHVLDSSGQLLMEGDSDGTRRRQPLGAAAGLGLVVARDDEVLWFDGGGALRTLGAHGEAGRSLGLRGQQAWQRPVALAAYAGNLYVLDAGSPGAAAGGGVAGQIWRHPGTPNGGFDAEGTAWLQAGTQLVGPRGFAIDGAIWVALGDGGLARFNGGRPEPVQLVGLDVPMLSAGAVYTEAGFKSVYVIDAAARRLVQFGKNGTYERQVPEAFPVGDDPRGLWVDEASGRVLLLTDQRLMEVVLN